MSLMQQQKTGHSPKDNSDGRELQVLIKSMPRRKERLQAIPE